MERRKSTWKSGPKQVDTLRHGEASRPNIPTAEYRAVMGPDERKPIPVTYARRNRDLDPQLVWRGKDEQDARDLVVQAPPLYIQEKIQPQALINDLLRRSERRVAEGVQQDFFADFNGLPEGAERTDFYQHEGRWSNRLILGDSLQVMASLAAREGLRGQVQCIYLDPPYGIKFNSNFQWSTTSRDVRDGKREHITREPEQVKAFRDTWRDGIHSYLSYLRDRLEVARDLLAESGSIFVQIGDENVHRVRALMDEVFGEDCFISQIAFLKTTGATSATLAGVADFILWYGRNSRTQVKYRGLWQEKTQEAGGSAYKPVSNIRSVPSGLFNPSRFARLDQITSQSGSGENPPLTIEGKTIELRRGSWKTNPTGMERLKKATRVALYGRTPSYLRFTDDFPVFQDGNVWTDTRIAGFASNKWYIVETATKVIQRCILMTTDPGDLVLDPTCGSGTTAYVAEQWGRRWITIDTSRVALALARMRIMGARYPWYLLADSEDGAAQEEKLSAPPPPIPYNSTTIASIRASSTSASRTSPSAISPTTPRSTSSGNAIRRNWSRCAKCSTTRWVKHGKSGKSRARLIRAGQTWRKSATATGGSSGSSGSARSTPPSPATPTSSTSTTSPTRTGARCASPHRLLGLDEDDELIDPLAGGVAEAEAAYDAPQDFAALILEHLRSAGVQQAQRADRLSFSALTPWPGDLVCATGEYVEDAQHSGPAKRAGVFIGPEFGTVTRPDLVEAAREAAEAGCDVLVACAFNYEAQTADFDRLGSIPVLKARMNADLHMANELKNTGAGNLFVVFGEPDIDILAADDDPAAEAGQLQVRVNGVDVFDPSAGQIRSDDADGIACWFIDTDYNGESFFVLHAYFLGAANPYKSLQTTLKAEIDAEACATLHSDTSRPFDRPTSGRIAVKVINHLGDEVMKVFRVA